MAGENVSGINPYMGMPMYNNYMNNVMLDDLCGYNSGIPNMMGMDGSLFNGGATPYMPTFGGGMNYDSYFKNMEQYQDFMYDSQIRQADRQREVNFRANVPEEVLVKQIDILHEKIIQNEQEQVLPALRSILVSLSETAGNTATQEQLLARADLLYQQRYGTPITEDLRKYGNGSATQGFLQTISFGFADNVTAEENIATINGQPVSRWEDTKKILGSAAGGALFGGAGLFLLSSLKLLGKLFKSKPLVAAAVGAGVGALSGAGVGAVQVNSRKQLNVDSPQTN